jgi:hypothetical protein
MQSETHLQPPWLQAPPTPPAKADRENINRKKIKNMAFTCFYPANAAVSIRFLYIVPSSNSRENRKAEKKHVNLTQSNILVQ